MNYGQLRSMVLYRLRDLKAVEHGETLINTYLNEGLRKMAFETLLLETLDSSLTYSSANDGFSLPTDFIKVKHLKWVDSQNAHHEVNAQSLSHIYEMRNEWLNLNEDTADALTPMGYAIQNGYIILDSISQSSPYLYYYKYDTALINDTDSPSFDSEFHSALVDYAIWRLHGDPNALQQWEYIINKMRESRMKQHKGLRARYVGL